MLRATSLSFLLCSLSNLKEPFLKFGKTGKEKKKEKKKEKQREKETLQLRRNKKKKKGSLLYIWFPA